VRDQKAEPLRLAHRLRRALSADTIGPAQIDNDTADRQTIARKLTQTMCDIIHQKRIEVCWRLSQHRIRLNAIVQGIRTQHILRYALVNLQVFGEQRWMRLRWLFDKFQQSVLEQGSMRSKMPSRFELGLY